MSSIRFGKTCVAHTEQMESGEHSEESNFVEIFLVIHSSHNCQVVDIILSDLKEFVCQSFNASVGGILQLLVLSSANQRIMRLLLSPTHSLLVALQLQRVFGFSVTAPLNRPSVARLTTTTTTAVAAKKSDDDSSKAKTDRSELASADKWLDEAVRATEEAGGFDESSFLVGILGDLHIDPRKLGEYSEGRDHWKPILKRAEQAHGNVAMVSLGDLGESKNCEHNENNPSELFAGTSLCHTIAAEFLSSFEVPYEVIGGNHDLEGIDEFRTDKQNLDCFMKAHSKPTPQFCREIADKTLLVGLCSTIFREAPYTSHEVIIDQDQIDWFENLLKSKPADEGWKIFVFTHAPPNGSGLRVLQENHVVK